MVSIHIDFAFTPTALIHIAISYDVRGASPLTRMLERPGSILTLPQLRTRSNMDDTVFAAISYLHSAFRRRNRIRRSRARFRLRQMYTLYDNFIAVYQRQMLLRMVVIVTSTPLLYMWSRSRSTPHIAFTLQNLIHLLGSKLPQSGSFAPHRQCRIESTYFAFTLHWEVVSI